MQYSLNSISHSAHLFANCFIMHCTSYFNTSRSLYGIVKYLRSILTHFPVDDIILHPTTSFNLQSHLKALFTAIYLTIGAVPCRLYHFESYWLFQHFSHTLVNSSHISTSHSSHLHANYLIMALPNLYAVVTAIFT